MKKILIILALATFTGMLGMTVILPLIPIFIEDLNLSPIWVGIIFAVFAGARVITSPIIGRLSDRWGRKPFLIIGLIMVIISSLSYVWAATGWQLVIIRIFHGTAAGMVYPIASSYLGDVTPEGQEGKLMGYFNAVVFTSFGIGPLFGGLLVEKFGLLIAFSSVAGLCLVSLLTIIFGLPESAKRHIKEKEGISIQSALRSRILLGIMSYRFSLEAAWGIWVSFIAVFASSKLGLGPSLSGILLTTNVFISALLMLPFGRLSDRVDKRLIVLIGGIGAAVSIAITPLATSFGFLLALSILAGVVSAAEFPATSAMSVEQGRKFGMGTTMAMMNVAMSLGMVFGPLMGGGIMESSGIPSTYYFAGGLLFLGVIAFLSLSIKYHSPSNGNSTLERDQSV